MPWDMNQLRTSELRMLESWLEQILQADSA
jgi:hypothetical protein